MRSHDLSWNYCLERNFLLAISTSTGYEVEFWTCNRVQLNDQSTFLESQVARLTNH